MSEWSTGDELQGFTRLVTQERVEAYANAAGDFNPIHLDAEFAKTTQFGRRIAHGMLVLAFATELLASNFPGDWHRSGRLKVRFKSPVFPGEEVTAWGRVTGVGEEDGRRVVQVSIGCRKPDGEDAVSGTAEISTAG